MDCIFCKIIGGTAVASIVYQDDVCTAFFTIEPITPGHMLVVPNIHADGLASVSSETAGHIFRVGQRLASALRKSEFRCDGVNLVMCDGAAAGQTVFHAHLHVNPRYEGDGVVLPKANHRLPSRDTLDTNAVHMRNLLAGDKHPSHQK